MCCMNKCKECLFNYGFSDNIQISDAPYSVQGKEFLKKAENLRITKEKTGCSSPYGHLLQELRSLQKLTVFGVIALLFLSEGSN